MTRPPSSGSSTTHRDAVWRFLVAAVGRDDADDCFQETFMAAMRAYPRMRPDSNLRAWVLTIAHRKALDHHRARRAGAVPVERACPSGRARRPRAADDGSGTRVRGLPPKQRAAVTAALRRRPPARRDRRGARLLARRPRGASLHEGLQEAARWRWPHDDLTPPPAFDPRRRGRRRRALRRRGERRRRLRDRRLAGRPARRRAAPPAAW